MIEHTPLPWETTNSPWSGIEGPHKMITSSDQPFFGVAAAFGDDDTNIEANAAFIVHAVNCHDDLLAALESVCAEGPKKPPHPYASDAMHKRWRIFELARAAIAKAKGQTD